MRSLYIFMTALFAALIMVPFLLRWALDTGTMDVPDERKVHNEAVPRIGGIAIFVAFLFSLLVYVDMSREIRGILAGGLLLFVTGIVDDLYGMSPRRKFFGEIAGALITIAVGHLYVHRLGDLFGLGPVELPFWLAIPFTVFAVVGVINAINLIDGLDGLAGGVSVIALVAFSYLGWLAGNSEVLALCAGLLGALLGFLKYNFYPARVFMGDVGSLVVGFVLAFVAVSLTQKPGSPISPIVPLLILGLPIIDTVWVLARRLARGQSPFTPDQTHVHHRFLDLGFQHRFIVVNIYGVSLFWAAFSVFFHDAREPLLLACYVTLSCGLYLGLRYVLCHRERFAFLTRDSAQRIRDSVTYRRLADRTALTVPLLRALILAYCLLAVPVGAGSSSPLLQMLLVVLAGSLALLYLTRDSRDNFVLTMFYFAGMIITVIVEKNGGRELLAGVKLGQVTEPLFAAIVFLVVVRLLLHGPGEFFLTSVDYLILGTSIFLAVVIPQLEGVIHLSGFFIKGIVLFLALKSVSSRGKAPARVTSYGFLAVMLSIVVRGYWPW